MARQRPKRDRECFNAWCKGDVSSLTFTKLMTDTKTLVEGSDG